MTPVPQFAFKPQCSKIQISKVTTGYYVWIEVERLLVFVVVVVLRYTNSLSPVPIFSILNKKKKTIKESP